MELFGGDVLDASSELGDGFEVLDNKDRVVDVPFVLISWSFSTKGKFGEFVSARLVTEGNGKYVINDGGTGIYAQLREFTDTHGGRDGGLFVRKGLRKSEYSVDLPDPKTGEIVPTPAVTYYLSTSA